MRQKSLIFTALFLPIFFAAVVPSARAGDDSVTLLIDVLEASDQPGQIDPGLAYIREQIRRAPFRYQRYRTLASASRTVPMGKSDTLVFLVPEEFIVEITPQKADARTIQVALRIRQKKKAILDTSLSLARGGTVMIGGPSTEHSAIMFAVSEGL
jgi:hypothetical protein